MLAIDDSASIFCARVMRGTWSMAIAVTLPAASRSTSALFLPGHRKLIRVAPGRSRSASWTSSVGCCSGGWTFRTMSASCQS